MKKKKRIVLSILIASINTVVILYSVFFNATRTSFNRAAGTNYSLELTNKKISDATTSYVDERSASITTTNGNSITFTASNVIDYSSGWQTVLPNGYFYNPYSNSTNNNKISDIKSIRFDSNDSCTLTLHFGNAINGSIVYSQEKTLTSNTDYAFTDEHPDYFYIKNTSGANVNINKLTVEYTCSSQGYAKQNYNVLMIGNSFADDTVYYSSRIANSYGINLNIHDAYIGGCTIDQHYSNLSSNSETYSMRSFDMATNKWVYSDNMSLSAIINSNTWDVITFQQASAQVGRSNSYSNLSSLVSLVRGMVGETPKFYWYQTWAYDSDYHDANDYFAYFGNNQTSMFNAIISCYQSQVAPLNLFSKFIPAGTAVQNTRTSYMKDTICRDGKHMSSIHGRYLLGLNFISNVLDIDMDMCPCEYLPEDINASYQTLCYESIRNAFHNPFVVTNSSQPTFNTGHDLSNYTEIDAELVGCSYWNSTDSSNYNKRICNASGSSNKYVSTKRFTSADLPVGSFVTIGEAFGVRPEAWVTDAVQSTRPNVTYQNVIEIDSNFFNGYEYRAFNIFKCGTLTLADSNGVGEQYSQIFDNFHIYVPNSAMGSLNPKGYNDKAAADRNLFEAKGYKFDSYERIHIDPIMGFYKCDSYYALYNSYTDDTAKKFVCTRAFYSANGDLPENTVIVVDSGYQWRSDCWGDYGTYSPRPSNVSTQFTVLNSSFWNGFRRRTFNVSSTNSYYVNQNHVGFLNHMRIYVPTSSDIQDEYPSGSFVGMATAAGRSLGITISIGSRSNGLVAVSLANTDAVATGITYNEDTKQVSITTTGSYSTMTFGTITGTYQPANNRIVSVRCNGSISSSVSNNGSITCSMPTSCYYSCDGSTNELQAQFKRRYMDGGWNVDNSNADRIVSDIDHCVSGGALKLRPYSSNAVALNLASDFSGGIKLKNIQFWVYNPSNTDITLRQWIYKATGFESNAEIGSVTAYANSWTYCAMGFTQSTIYNFQIADFTKSGVSLTFDNIVLFNN